MPALPLHKRWTIRRRPFLNTAPPQSKQLTTGLEQKMPCYHLVSGAQTKPPESPCTTAGSHEASPERSESGKHPGWPTAWCPSRSQWHAHTQEHPEPWRGSGEPSSWSAVCRARMGDRQHQSRWPWTTPPTVEAEGAYEREVLPGPRSGLSLRGRAPSTEVSSAVLHPNELPSVTALCSTSV